MPLNDDTARITPQELQEALRTVRVPAVLQENSLLFDRRMQRRRYRPGAGAIRQRWRSQLRTRNETKLRVSGRNKLQRLRNALADDQPRFYGIPETGLLQEFPGGGAVRCGCGICDRDAHAARVVEGATAIRKLPRPQHEFADRIRESRARDRRSGCFEALWPVAISCQKDIKWRAIDNLGVELAGRRGNQPYSVSGIRRKLCSDLVDRHREITRHCDSHDILPGRKDREQKQCDG